TKPGTLCEPAPVVDVRNGHVVNATRDAIRFTDTHHRDIDDLVHLAGDDLRKMTYVARSFGVGEKRHLPCVADILKIAPHHFSDRMSRLHFFRVIAVAWRDCLYLIAIKGWAISGLFYSAEGAVPNDDATTGMTCRRQPILNRVHNVMVRCEKLATCRRDLDTDAVIRRDQRSPCLGHVTLSGHSEH